MIICLVMRFRWIYSFTNVAHNPGLTECRDWFRDGNRIQAETVRLFPRHSTKLLREPLCPERL